MSNLDLSGLFECIEEHKGTTSYPQLSSVWVPTPSTKPLKDVIKCDYCAKGNIREKLHTMNCMGCGAPLKF